MKNEGHQPNVDRCDIRYRSGWIARDIDPAKRRWSEWPTGQDDWDIIDWQPVKRRAA